MGEVRVNRTYYPGTKARPKGCRSQVKAGGKVALLRSSSPGRIVVSRKEQSYAEENGWTLQDGTYWGRYRTAHGSWKGSVEQTWRGSLEFFIHNPPKELKEHSHWICFHHRGEGRYWVHFRTEPENLSAGILEVERILAEASELHKKTKKTTLVMPGPSPAMSPTFLETLDPPFKFKPGEFRYEPPKIRYLPLSESEIFERTTAILGSINPVSFSSEPGSHAKTKEHTPSYLRDSFPELY
jgi:hypothetical protein